MAVPGTVMMWGGTTANLPFGWLYCDGTQVSRAVYPDLFAAIGFNFGANPSDGMFYLPDLRGRFIRGVDDETPPAPPATTRDPDVASRVDMQDPSIQSSTVGSVQSDAFQSHSHGFVKFPAYGGGNGIASGSYWGGTDTDNAETGSAGTSAETRPKNAYLYFLIRYAPEVAI